MQLNGMYVLMVVVIVVVVVVVVVVVMVVVMVVIVIGQHPVFRCYSTLTTYTILRLGVAFYLHQLWGAKGLCAYSRGICNTFCEKR